MGERESVSYLVCLLQYAVGAPAGIEDPMHLSTDVTIFPLRLHVLRRLAQRALALSLVLMPACSGTSSTSDDSAASAASKASADDALAVTEGFLKQDPATLARVVSMSPVGSSWTFYTLGSPSLDLGHAASEAVFMSPTSLVYVNTKTGAWTTAAAQGVDLDTLRASLLSASQQTAPARATVAPASLQPLAGEQALDFAELLLSRALKALQSARGTIATAEVDARGAQAAAADATVAESQVRAALEHLNGPMHLEAHIGPAEAEVPDQLALAAVRAGGSNVFAGESGLQNLAAFIKRDPAGHVYQYNKATTTALTLGDLGGNAFGRRVWSVANLPGPYITHVVRFGPGAKSGVTFKDMPEKWAVPGFSLTTPCHSIRALTEREGIEIAREGGRVLSDGDVAAFVGGSDRETLFTRLLTDLNINFVLAANPEIRDYPLLLQTLRLGKTVVLNDKKLIPAFNNWLAEQVGPGRAIPSAAKLAEMQARVITQ